MKVKCYNCGKASPDKPEWYLVNELHWTGKSKKVATGDDWKKGDTLDSIFKRIGIDWYCPDCIQVGFDSVFGLPVRMQGRRN